MGISGSSRVGVVLLVEGSMGGVEVRKEREMVMLETHTIDDGTRQVECRALQLLASWAEVTSTSLYSYYPFHNKGPFLGDPRPPSHATIPMRYPANATLKHKRSTNSQPRYRV